VVVRGARAHDHSGRIIAPATFFCLLDKHGTPVQDGSMTARRGASAKGKAHRFGGEWTSAKLEVLAGYLHAYTMALRDKPMRERPFRKAYIDAFAGTGYRTEKHEESTRQADLAFPDLAAVAPQDLLDGSARLALKNEPRFDRYIFIERSLERCQQLEQMKTEFPALASDISVLQGDANQEIQKLCAKDWSSNRAVLFLDPYGMQVEWATIEAIARTKAIDLWLLFPLGIGVNRLLTRSGDIPTGWRRRLDLLLGTTDWYDEFYQVETKPTLFQDEEERVVKASIEAIGKYFNDRLRTVFHAVAAQPGVLRNSANCPLYLLCFAAGNPTGAPIAMRIADSLLKKVR
jgi:three-Cys-motif partner protein